MQQSIEIKALWVGVLLNLIMAIAGWYTYYLSYAEAILLDGNFSFVLCIGSLLALQIMRIKNRSSETFPYGLYFNEALYSLLKAMVVFGVIIMALTENSVKIFHYFNGQSIQVLVIGPIAVYSVLMSVLCFFLAWFYHRQNKKLRFFSSILEADSKASIIDGWLSVGMGIALFSTGFVKAGSDWQFLMYIGDALVVVTLCLLLMGQPMLQIKQSFIELVGGRLTDSDTTDSVNASIRHYLPEAGLVKRSFISKTGSHYLVVVYLRMDAVQQLHADKLKVAKDQIEGELREQLTYVLFELVLE